MREVAQKNELLQVTATIPLVLNQAEYDFPPNIMNLMSIVYQGKPLRGTGFKEFQTLTIDDDETLTVGAPQTFTTWANKIRLYPVPDRPGNLKVYYLREPSPITALAETPELPQSYHMRLVEYCLAMAAEFDEDPERYAQKMGEFEARTAELRDKVDWTEKDQYPVISASPEEYGDHYDRYTYGWG
jgi:hypothetical protein